MGKLFLVFIYIGIIWMSHLLCDGGEKVNKMKSVHARMTDPHTYMQGTSLRCSKHCTVLRNLKIWLDLIFRAWPREQMLGDSQHSACKNSAIRQERRAQQPMGDVVLPGLYNQQWTSVFTINELQFPECWYPESWRGLEWHLLNPGAEILATANAPFWVYKAQAG